MYRGNILGFAAAGLGIWSAFSISTSLSPAQEIRWQKLDQLCARLESVTPTKKVIRRPDGNSETLLYGNPFKATAIVLYKAGNERALCCEGAIRIAETNSDKYGHFAFVGNPGGHYWPVIRLKDGDVTVPVFADNYSARFCESPNTDRIVYVDAKPKPKIEVHII